MIHATGVGESVAGLAALAPHSFVEDKCVDAIAAMRVGPERLLEALGHLLHHEALAALCGLIAGFDYRALAGPLIPGGSE